MFRVPSFALIVLFLLVPTQDSFAQSGSRNVGGGGGGISGGGGGYIGGFGGRGRSREQRRLDELRRQQQTQQLAESRRQQNQRNQELARQELLRQLSQNPNSKTNRKLSGLALEHARKEYMALQRQEYPASIENLLNESFRLGNRDINRKTGQIHWPKALQDMTHEELVRSFENAVRNRLSGKQNTGEDPLAILAQLNRQLQDQAIAKKIAVNDYAKSKRFLRGLAIESTYPGR